MTLVQMGVVLGLVQIGVDPDIHDTHTSFKQSNTITKDLEFQLQLNQHQQIELFGTILQSL